MPRICASGLLLTTFVLACAWPTSASAQDVPSEVAQPVEPLPSTPAESDPRHSEATERFDRAAALFERGDARGALAEMQAVYDLLEGQADQYVVLYNFGRIYEALHRYDRAVELYRRYLVQSPPEGADRADAEAALRVLERLLGTLVVRVNVPTQVWMGEDLVGEAPGEILLPAGAHTLELRAPGYEVVRREAELTAGSRLELEVTLARLGDVQGISPAFAISSAVVGLVSLGLGIGLGVHALSLRGSADACVGPGRDVCDPVALAQSIGETALGADVAFGGAVLFLVTATVLTFLTDWDGENSGQHARVWPTPSLAGSGLRLAF